MLSLAVIGLGYWGPNLARNIASSSQTRLVGLCDASASRLEVVGDRFPAAARYSSVEELVSDSSVDAVAIATPVASHHRIARMALLAGKHVIVEKPFTASSAEAEDLIEIAEREKLVLMLDHVFLYSPPVRKLHSLVVNGELGALQFLDSVRINLGLVQHDVNVLWDLAPHDLSIMDLVIGRAPESIVALGSAHAAGGIVDAAYLHLDYGEGVTAAVHVNWLSPVKLRHFMVGGSRRSVVYNDLDRSEPIKIYDRGVEVGEDPEGKRGILVSYRSGDVLSPRVDSTEPLRAMVEHFAECVASGEEPLSSAQQGLRLVRILEAADQSLSNAGKRIAVGTP